MAGHACRCNDSVTLSAVLSSGRILSDVREMRPDFAVLQWRADDYTSRTPAAANALLVVEVADSTLRYDRDVKRRFYAEAGVREFWVVDVHARQILVHRGRPALPLRADADRRRECGR
ncbi:MAG TPA: Uma2 family endonuclease [Burkholderiaceae bacterium]|nr:Uma2 family endonuclease [Burkholderiaceae bacterium]